MSRIRVQSVGHWAIDTHLPFIVAKVARAAGWGA